MNSQLYRSEVPCMSRLLSLLFVFCAGCVPGSCVVAALSSCVLPAAMPTLCNRRSGCPACVLCPAAVCFCHDTVMQLGTRLQIRASPTMRTVHAMHASVS